MIQEIKKRFKKRFVIQISLIIFTFVVCVCQFLYIINDNKKFRYNTIKLINKINKQDSIIYNQEKFYQKIIKENNLLYDSLLKKQECNNHLYIKLYAMNWENVCFWIDYFKIKHSNVVKAQILLETLYLTSDICLYNRNLFGMKYFTSLDNYALGEVRGHAYYGTYVESIMAYKAWQDKYYKFDKKNYLVFLERIGYAKDVNYIPKLKFIMKKYHLDYN